MKKTFKRWILSFFFRYIYTDEEEKNMFYIIDGRHKRRMMPEMVETFSHLKWFKKIDLRKGKTFRVSVERQRAKYNLGILKNSRP